VIDGHHCHFSCKHGVFQGLAKLRRGSLAKVKIGSLVCSFKTVRVFRHVKHKSKSWWASQYATAGRSRLWLRSCSDPNDATGTYDSWVAVKLVKTGCG
jgi:hypothetical protein